MTDDGARPPWTDDQWASLQRFVAEAARRARVASSFLPLVGPLPGGEASVPKQRLEQGKPTKEWFGGTAAERLDIDDAETLKLTTLACDVFVKTQQAADPELASVRQMLERATVLIGRLEDAIVFNEQPGENDYPRRADGKTGVVQPEIYTVSGGGAYPGLLRARPAKDCVSIENGGAEYGNRLVTGVVEAIETLEGRGQYGPFACVLGHDLYLAANTPSPDSLVLPSDRFVPFLAGGPLLRSSTVPGGEGVVVALAGAPIDLVIASDIHVSYVQRTTEPRYVLRVSERMVLRLKQPDAVARLLTVKTQEQQQDPPQA